MTDIRPQIIAAEEALRQAMLASNVDTLDQLISNDLVFTNHFGHLLTKDADLETHRTGVLRLNTLDPSEQLIKLAGDIAIVSVRMRVAGQYAGTPFNDDLRYTRVWRKADGQWRVVAGHISAVG